MFAFRFFNIFLILVVCYLKFDETSAAIVQNKMIKPGSCPPLSPRSICTNRCQFDRQCPGVNKCCETACGGTFCSRPVTTRKNIHKVKSGTCPSNPGGPWFCSSRCTSDSDCRGTQKCCVNRCGALGCYAPEVV